MNEIKIQYRVEKKCKIAEIHLSRPDVRNAFNASMIEGLTHAFSTQINSDPTLRAVVLRGEGKSFCAGADMEWMKSMVQYTLSQNVRDAEELGSMFAAIRLCQVPVIAMVQGHAMGGGLGLMAVSDIVIAESSTQFAFSEVKLGIIPAVISPFVIEKSSVGVIMPYLLSGEIFDTEKAKQMGLVHFSGDTAYCENELSKQLQNFVIASPEAVRRCKKLMREVVQSTSWEEVRKLTAKSIAEARVSKEGQEGLKSFLEKREPGWRQ